MMEAAEIEFLDGADKGGRPVLGMIFVWRGEEEDALMDHPIV